VSATFVITGATGFLGTQVARRLLAMTDGVLVAVVRAEGQEQARRRLSRAWWEWPELVTQIGSRVEVLPGDVAQPGLGLDETSYGGLVERVTHVIHAAADLRLGASLEELRKTNVGGTAHVLELALAAHADHGLARFAHVSTAYVAGRRRGEIKEAGLDDSMGFCNSYERSKYEGERLVRESSAQIPVSVFRPGMIVGDSKTGAVKTFNTLYVPLRLYLSGHLRVAPVSPRMRVNLVPVDYVSEAVVKLVLDPRAEGETFHLTAPWDSLPTVGELVVAVRRWARDRLGVRLPRPLFLPVPLPTRSRGEDESPASRGSLALLSTLAPYLRNRRRFVRENVDRLLGPYDFDWHEFLPHLLEYAVYCGFLHRSERTVHEQVAFRLAGKSRPVVYHDIAQSATRTRSARDVRQEILRAVSALEAMGIVRGDRVAIVGPNGTRYLSLDVAIGLVGAASVPLYPTSAPSEMEAILEDAGVRALFVGTPGLLERLAERGASFPVVSFSRDDLPDRSGGRVLTWEEFLTRGNDGLGRAEAPVDFSDLATLRYTSGTTGSPKGVAFDHGNLRFMAESLGSLFPWHSRTRRVVYLSFLPMNHVVEGILTTYGPYYAPAPLDLFFLEDFRDLARVLPRVRPTVFFSVPRFYEKVWEGVECAPVVRRFARSSGGPKSRIMRRLLRWSILRKAGLDRCAQLVVGSAPSRPEVLAGFQKLGIEIHNAYGLTEAPLVTMNRLGRNRLGTVGEPLPETEVRLAQDGEVLVRGPQVTRGCFGEGEDLGLSDGWLATGDLGHLDEARYLVIEGRKKQVIVTSYGKNVLPERTESLLREIPGVREAMLVGDGQPYCVALLWMDETAVDETGAAGIDWAVEGANVRLSRPEQARAWALIPYDLSGETGELTANLKLRRGEIVRLRTAVIDALYERGPIPPGVVHVGRTEREL